MSAWRRAAAGRGKSVALTPYNKERRDDVARTLVCGSYSGSTGSVSGNERRQLISGVLERGRRCGRRAGSLA